MASRAGAVGDSGRRAFSLIETLIVVTIVALLVSILMPAIHRVRQHVRQVACLSNLHGVSVGLTGYVTSNRDRLPFVQEPLWANYATTGKLNWDADPNDSAHYPFGFGTVMKRYLADSETLHCPGASLGLPAGRPTMTYRVSSADNYDGTTRMLSELELGNGLVRYEYSLKYLNGRPYAIRHVAPYDIPWRLVPGAGPYYLVRDFIGRAADGRFQPPHGRGFNQLFLDLHADRLFDPKSFSYP